ncbi:hypothetical protein [Tropicibacter sp. S64]|uniref:hypothetical protein n=1 Tax=Tropicibacter sp. S64 TaxID=3415122 RepID=UPI003C7D42F4
MRPFLLPLLLLAAPALAWEEPARGTATRTNIMDAIRPHIEWALGAPVEFVVWDLRRDGDVAFASLMAQRPGGGVIDVYATPAPRRGEIDPEVGDGATVQALLQKSGDTWVATHHAIGATDMWWAWEEFCPIWHTVIPEVCGG